MACWDGVELVRWRLHLRRLSHVSCARLPPRCGLCRSIMLSGLGSAGLPQVITNLISPLPDIVLVLIHASVTLGATHTSIFLSSVHFASSDGRGPMLRIFGEGILRLVANARAGVSDEKTRLMRLRTFVNVLRIGSLGEGEAQRSIVNSAEER